MSTKLPAKVPFRVEHSKDVQQDRAQILAQRVAAAHEQTKFVVSALMNQAYKALVADVTIVTAAYAVLISTTITTVLDTGNLVVQFSASGQKAAASGSIYFELYIDNVLVKGTYVSVNVALPAWAISMVVRKPVTKGAHTVELRWRTDVNLARIAAASVAEEHAHLLAQEAL